jgi:vacuolar protein sorting-associated protein 45
VYASSHSDFTNVLQKSFIERLAEGDTHEVVREVQEYFADFVAVNQDLFSLNFTANDHIYAEELPTWDPNTLKRVAEGVSSVLLALKKKPLIRYEKNSALCRKLADDVSYIIQSESQLFDFRKSDAMPILLLLDRRNDPVTPLLNQWTYQAMIHEMIGIDNGRVDLSHVAGIKLDNKEVVLSIDNDSFYSSNMFLDLGDLGINIKNYVQDYQKKHHSTKNIESIADMKKFVEDYPEFQKLSGNVSKHVALVGELSGKIEREHLLEIGELEQSLACTDSFASHLKSVQTILNRPDISLDAKLRLLLLYAIRYEKTPNNQVDDLKGLLAAAGLSPDKHQV